MSQPTYSPSPPTNTLAVVSLVSGILSWFIVPLLGAIIAVITGHMARNQIRDSYGAQGGDVLALIGLILGYLNLVLSCVLPVLVFAGVISVGGICSICGILSESGGLSMVNSALPPLP